MLAFAAAERGWDEQRLQLQSAAVAVEGSRFGARIAAELAALRPVLPQTVGYTQIPLQRNSSVAQLRLGPSLTVGIDEQTGAITRLRAGTKELASPRAPLAELWYKTNDLDEELSMSANYSVQLPDPWGGGGLGVRNWPHGSSANTWRPPSDRRYPASSGRRDLHGPRRCRSNRPRRLPR